ncbi:MAG: class A beta-lactamase-related serine hydrolase [Rhodanobacter sp.]|nr:MAG: class A beta-lactamase-related serine hydrolase [Rhodanobacter sp.]TAL94995.1 MAG: class A beta-lactamase-related serine hydrolase [Rhodanobacter sp.]TAM43138.1 MAG: class A beta-lactamase-related serine hydrolase [Rhodanobacter sp.]TAN26347.1 MAG: class A beta-lactamase-related serine hydrolase [Rhodanobacter sp.]
MPLRKIFTIVTGVLGLACTPICATPATTSIPPPAVVSVTTSLPSARIQKTLADYKRWLRLVERRDAAAGLATAVVIDDKVVFEGTIGYADATTREPVTPTTVFRLASLSKAFATALTGLLVNDRKLSWDTRLIDMLPYFKLKDMQAADQATVSDILGQKLGLPRNTYDNMLEDDVSYQELVRKLDEVDMTCGVGQCYGYQNVAFSMIGDVVLARTGDFFYHQVDKRLFYPLGMSTASYGRAALESSKSWARPHHASRHGWVPFEPNQIYYRVAPAAGVNASLRDMEKWLIAQMGGRQDVLPTALLDVLHAPGVVTPGELRATPWRRARLTDAHYALGWRVYKYADETLIYHAGAVAGYRTMIGFFPKYHVGVVTLWNSSGPTPSGLMPMVFDDLLGLPHVDWAQIESDAKKPALLRAKHRKTPSKRRH